MANEPKVPEVRDDDPEDVSDKLSIAAAMWGRGDRADALTWVRRAAEAASDADQDMRALELAKAASELASLAEAAAKPPSAAPPKPMSAAPPPAVPETPAAGPPGPPPRPKTAPPPKPSMPPPNAPGRAPVAASSIPKKQAPGSKLPPLPPLRPLGTPAAAPPKAPRVPSMITSAMGTASTSGTVEREELPSDALKSMPWDEQRAHVDDEPTKQIALEPAPEPEDLDQTATREIASTTMQPEREGAAPPPAVRELPLAVGVRVRVQVAADGVHIVPEGESTEGIAAVIVPLDAHDDLRSLFQRRA